MNYLVKLCAFLVTTILLTTATNYVTGWPPPPEHTFDILMGYGDTSAQELQSVLVYTFAFCAYAVFFFAWLTNPNTCAYYMPRTTLSYVTSMFKYTPDEDRHGFVSVWRTSGIANGINEDCEDFALSLLYRLTNSRRRMIWWLFCRTAKLDYMQSDLGTGHIQLWVDHRVDKHPKCAGLGQYTDIVTDRWNDGTKLALMGYHKKFTVPVTLIIIKLLFSKARRVNHNA